MYIRYVYVVCVRASNKSVVRYTYCRWFAGNKLRFLTTGKNRSQMKRGRIKSRKNVNTRTRSVSFCRVNNGRRFHARVYIVQ